MTELTINASSFKARCLEIMDQLATHKLTRVTITKRGKPVSVMQPPPETVVKRSIIGCMADVMPQLTDAEWEEVEREASTLSTVWPTEAQVAAKFSERMRDAG